MYLSKLSVRDMLVLSLLIICSIIVTWYMIDNIEHAEGDIVHVQVEDNVTKEVVFKKLDLAPGTSCDYTLILEREEVVGYDVVFEFEETEELNLKNYVYVKMEICGEVFYEKLLADAFEEESFSIHINHETPEDDDITVTYYLPEDVGNEAQSAKSTFKLLVTATSQAPVEGEK